MKRKLFPTLHESMTTAACKLPDSILEYVDKLASRQMRSRSDTMRVLIIEALRAQGVVATSDEMEAEREAA